MSNYWNSNGDLVTVDRTVFRQVGWKGQSGAFYSMEQPPTPDTEPGSFAPLYEEIESFPNTEPRIGFATTRDLLAELRARIEIDYFNGGGGLDYTAVNGRPEGSLES